MRDTTEFVQWLQEQLDTRGWLPADLAKEAKIAKATLSNLFQGNRGIGPEVAKKIARALGHDPEFVMQKAGILPKDKDSTDIELREWIAIGRKLTAQERAELLAWAIAKLDRRDK